MKTGRETTKGALLLVIVIGLTIAIGLSRWIDSHRLVVESSIDEQQLYLTGSAVRRVSLGFNGLAADWYWMRSLQYVGRKLLSSSADIQLDNLGPLNLKLLAPLLDAATTLDPQFMEPYQYTAVVLPAVDLQEAIRIMKKGIAANPSQWRLYHHLGYIYWQQRDFKQASETYGEGAKMPGAPPWMEAMKARMAGAGGSRNTAREIYRRMYEQAEDQHVKEMARRRLLQLDSLDERDQLRHVMAVYKTRFGRCPASWREVESILHDLKWKVDSSGAPLDPAGTPYFLVKDKCDVDLDWKSDVPSK